MKKRVLLFFLFSFCLFWQAWGSSPLALYLSLVHGENPAQSISISWLTSPLDKEDQVLYRLKQKKEWKEVQGNHYTIPGIYPETLLHRVDLTNLEPNQEYFFQIGKQGEIKKFCTLAQNLNHPLKIVIGGDAYHDQQFFLQKMNQIAAKQQPNLIVIGGDLAYAMDRFSYFPDAFLSWGISRKLRSRWIEWLKACSYDFITPDGKCIPLIAVVGNHDVNGGFNQTPKQAPQYCLFFPFPGKNGYSVLDIGTDLSLFLLDSGHMHPIQGEQTKWLEDALSKRVNRPFKFAVYHISAYPSVRKFESEPSQSIRNSWVPLFDQYQMTACFENHDHAYKRTHLLRNGNKDPSGVLYLGDGAWGVKEPRTPATPKERQYLAFSKAKRHIFLMTLYQKSCHIQAIDQDEIIFDEVFFER